MSAFAEADARDQLAGDPGCGYGWNLRALARRYPNLRGSGTDSDGAAEHVSQARALEVSKGLATVRGFLWVTCMISPRTNQPI